MEVKFNNWKSRMSEWAEFNHASFRIFKHAAMGEISIFFTAEIIYQTDTNYKVKISQSAYGTEDKVAPLFIRFESVDPQVITFDLSLYQIGFLERILNFNRLKTGNNSFDDKFGIYYSEKAIAARLFSNNKVQSIFLNNNLLVFNVQRKKSMISIRSMETKMYDKAELQELLNSFVFILNFLNN